MNARTIVALLLLALLGLFVCMNLDKANVWLFGIRAEMPIALVVFVSGGLGLLAGLLLAFVQKSGKKKPEKTPA
jgi:uncharacterized integral membrane protein